MIVTDSLCNILKESAETYESFIKLEYDKYDAVVRDDITRLDEIISSEQVFFLKIKGLEQKRQKLTQSMNMKDKTLKEIIELSNNEEKSKLKEQYDRLFKALSDFKKINSECKTLIEVRLHKINSAIDKQGISKNNYANNENRNNKSSIISKKI
jgi:ribosome assembly protein YihI (activator of Der GTPase)